MNYKKSIKKAAGRIVKKAGRAMKKRYITSTGKGLRVGQIVKDVALLKSMVNAEKKSFEVSATALRVGQCDGNSSGHYLLDLTPNIAQGAGYQQRNGNSVRWHSSYIRFSFQTSSNVTRVPTIKIMLVRVIGQPRATISDVMGTFIKPNPFITDQTIYDSYSERDSDYFKNFKVLRTKYVKFTQQYSGERQVRQINIPMKFGHHVKWNNDTSTTAEGQVFLLITSDTGNSSTTTVNTSTSPAMYSQAINSALTFAYNFTHYYYDN